MNKIEITDEMSGDEIVELGFGLIAHGLFRISERESFDDAIDSAWFLVDQVRLVAHDFENAKSNCKSSKENPPEGCQA